MFNKTAFKKNLLIAFVTDLNTQDKKVHSGVIYYLPRLLEKYCGQVDYIDNLSRDKITIPYILRNINHPSVRIILREMVRQLPYILCGKKFYWRRTYAIAKYYASIIQEKLKRKKYDVVFVEKTSACLAFLETDIPLIFSTDAPFKCLVDYYPRFTNLSKYVLKQANRIEETIMQKIKLFICVSNWAAESAMRDYHLNKKRILVAPRPPNLEIAPQRDIVLKHRNLDTCELLFMGVEWERKGGDTAIETVRELNNMGIKSRLTICGCLPPKKYINNKDINIVGFLDKNRVEDIIKWEYLFMKASFFILPTKAECQGIVFSEAAAYGLPVVATNTGGVSSTVHHGETGLLLNINAKGFDFAAAIRNIWNNVDKYNSMRFKARELYERELNEEAWGKKISEALINLIANE